jgi:hypothetical protein
MTRKKIKRISIISIIVILVCGSIFGTYLERNNNRPNGILSVVTFPYRGLKWIKHNEPVEIPPIPQDSLSYYYGSRIQRTMSLLNTSNKENQNKIKILFYGQSIVAGLNSESIINKLRKQYPDAIIEYENRAIGGFTAPSLVRTAVHDLYPFYPDLLIFHVYRGVENGELERIIYNTRKYTTSEILLFNHHYAWVQDSTGLVNRTYDDDIESDYWRLLAQKYGCELVDVRNEWKEYIAKHPSIEINNLMGDEVKSNVHPNKKGHKLLELLLLRHLKFTPIAYDKDNRGWFNEVRTYDMRRSHEEKKDEVEIFGNYTNTETGIILDSASLNMEFDGNRIELVLPDETYGEYSYLDILIDGEKPSKNPELYYVTRPSVVFGEKTRPALKRVSLGNNPVLEKWKLTITKIDRNTKYCEFKLVGEKTGYDGKGNNFQRFISNSGKIIIEPTDFFIFDSEKITNKQTPVGFEINWEVKPNFYDRITFNNKTKSYVVAQGLENENHNLTLIQDSTKDGFPIKSIIVYRPPMK